MAEFQTRYNPSDFRRALILALRAYSYNLRDQYKQKLIDGDVNASGSLIKSAIPFSGELASNVYAAGIRLADHWRHVERGRRPGGKFPPRQVIKDWMQQRNIIPKPYTLASGKSVMPTIEQVAFLIARKIAVEGIPAKPYLQETINGLGGELDTIVNDIVGEAITEIRLDIGTVRV